ncbi:MAG TPA: aspartate aminotransferase family protein [Parvibaculum sp.]|uniref:aspartate aminotransferase family protein n=1 Tax=Parvibaculum sp. TaxID=2024848 RepID=UPI002C492F01|nr:aspartate aminotransferase family protein [Parvibaculum sp.]HMM14883.1 aspartate aminotransferase family protein [Parvibaculum sp.]
MSQTVAKSNQTKRWQEMDAAHHLHPFTTHHDLAAKGARVITNAKGIYLYDSEGRRLIDGMAGLWCVQVGYGREELAEAGYKALKELSYYNSFFQTTNPYTAELSQRLSEVTPKGIDRFFFANSGSEGNDSAVKIIRYFWNLQGKPKKKIFIARKKAYHGVTLAAASLSGISAMHPQADLPLPGFVHIDCPYWYGEGGDMTPDEFGLKTARALEEKILELGAENVAAFVAEPVQGAGGLIIPPATYWAEINRICKKYDVLLHIDEVICGFGRTGQWFGSQTFGIEADMINMAKGLSSGYQPIAAVGLGQRVGDALFHAKDEWSHGFTYSGHPVACAVALANLDVLQKERLVEKVGGATGAHFQKKLAELNDHPLVGETRGVGLLGAIELVKNKKTREKYPSELDVGYRCRVHCFENGLVMRAIGDTMVLSPPLVITESELDELFALARKCIDLVARDLGVL